MKTIAVIYHANCLDGFGAAFAAWLCFKQEGKLDEVEFIPGFYQSELPYVAGKEVYLVDFSFKRDDLIKVCSVAKEVTVIDHHASAIKDLKGLDEELDNLYFYFSEDNSKSGAVLAWEYFMDMKYIPEFFRLIEDRDLWNWKYVKTKDFTAGLFAQPFEFEVWSRYLEDDRGIDQICEIGQVLNEQFDKELKSALKSVHRLKIAGFDVPALNVMPKFSSEAGNVLAQGEVFAAIYQIVDGVIRFSLRSSNEPQALDVSVIAAKFGGGGHKNAAGFNLPFTLGEINQ